VVVISRHGGVDVEQLATSGSSGTVKQFLDPERKAYRYTFLNMVNRAGFNGNALVKLSDIAWKVYETFLKYDAETVEINPVLINEKDGTVLAGDAKVIVDDYALYRQPLLEEFRRRRDSIESDVKSIFVELGGNIGVISLGASMTMMVIDTVKYMGGEPANFVDIAGGASKQNLKDMALQVMQKVVSNPDIKTLLITFTLVAHPLRSAVEAVVEAYQEIKPSVPVYVNIRAASAALISISFEEAIKILKDAGFIWCDYLDEAIAQVIEVSKAA
jgi:succinyl-CoA synthetase beta subunit